MQTPNTVRLPRIGYSAPMAHPDQPATRLFEVTALRADGTRSISTFKAPAIPLFESAFAAFARGVVLNGPAGPVAIEDLQPGDMLDTVGGAPARVVWIGSSNFVPADTGRRMPMVRVMADSFGPTRPTSFVTLGPWARILHTPAHLRSMTDGAPMLTPVHEFVDGVNVIEVVPPTPVRMFHICLTRHAAIDVGGIAVETFHPGLAAARRLSHAQRTFFLSMFPQFAHLSDFGPLAHPRAPEFEDDLTAA